MVCVPSSEYTTKLVEIDSVVVELVILLILLLTRSTAYVPYDPTATNNATKIILIIYIGCLRVRIAKIKEIFRISTSKRTITLIAMKIFLLTFENCVVLSIVTAIPISPIKAKITKIIFCTV